MEKKFDYTGRPLKNGEVLVLMPYDEMDVRVNCRNPKSIVAAPRGGMYVKAVLKAVPAEWEAEAKHTFNSWAIEQRPVRTLGRCLIPQPDGSKKPCPRKKGDNRCSCAECPHRGEYDREIIAPISYDQMVDDFGYDPIMGDESPEKTFFDAIDEQEGLKRVNDTLGRLTETSPKHGFAAKLLACGMRGAEFERELGLSHYACDAIRHQIADLAPDGITSFDQLDLGSLKANRSRHDERYRHAARELADFTE